MATLTPPNYPTLIVDDNLESIGAGICRVWERGADLEREPFADIRTAAAGGFVVFTRGASGAFPNRNWNGVRGTTVVSSVDEALEHCFDALAEKNRTTAEAAIRVRDAAPELLAALRAMVDEVRNYHPTFDAHRFVAAERAIAKAEGRKP